MKKLHLLLMLVSSALIAQENQKDYEGGKFQLGVRTVLSAFSDDGYKGFGVGGQFRIKFSNRLNTEWFADYITTDIGGLAKRTDYHIGWAVQFYPFNYSYQSKKIIPFIEAGHCFDYTEVMKTDGSNFMQSRWSSAVHSGLGTVFCLTDNVDFTLSAKYMLHMGKDIHAEIFKGPNDDNQILIEKTSASLEGHLLIAFSVNVLIADLWSKEK